MHPWNIDMTTVCYSNVYSVPAAAKRHKEIKCLIKDLPCWQKLFHIHIINKHKQNKRGSSWYQITWILNHMNLHSFTISLGSKLPYPCGKKHSRSWNNSFQAENTNVHGKCSTLLSQQIKSCFLIWEQNPFSDFSRMCNSPKSKSKFAILKNLHFGS